MPVNAGPDFIKAEEKYHSASSKEEKLAALTEMLRTVPKHKGSENVRKEFTTKIAKLRDEIEKEKKVGGKKGSGGPSINIKKDGDAQIAIIGLPNSGKSTFLNRLTDAQTPVAPYPFTTTIPVAGMMKYKGALLQLVEMPALVQGSSEGKANGTQILSAIRNTDAIIILALNDEEKKTIIKELENAEIKINQEKPRIIIKPGDVKGISLSGTNFLLKTTTESVISTLKAFGVHNASVIFQENTTIESLAQALNSKLVYKKAFFLNPFEEQDIEELKKKIFELSGKIIVYTKKPGQQPDLADPLVMDKGATVEECAIRLHKDLAKNLKSVRLWGSARFTGQNVSKDHKVEDGDVLEISI